jgi:hypothetical protein
VGVVAEQIIFLEKSSMIEYIRVVCRLFWDAIQIELWCHDRQFV